MSKLTLISIRFKGRRISLFVRLPYVNGRPVLPMDLVYREIRDDPNACVWIGG